MTDFSFEHRERIKQQSKEVAKYMKKSETQHPITPPPELVQEWAHMLEQHTDAEVFTQAARWGADMELEACCKLFESNSVCGTKFQRRSSVRDLRDKRRPKPPSLKERAFIALREVGSCEEIDNTTYNTIRKALEALPND